MGNPKGFFDKNFDDYKAGFESRGESHLQKATLDSISDSFAFSLIKASHDSEMQDDKILMILCARRAVARP